MPRKPRVDAPDTWHHVMNRGIARRPIFETSRDVRYFLSRLARIVRDGLLEVHAYTVLATHFHLLVRSPGGNLPTAMQRLQNEYSRWFNRGRKRDGPLFRGRYRSRKVESLTYRLHLVRYIDANAVDALRVATPALHPHCSARNYALHRGPPWLSREWIERRVLDVTAGQEYDPHAYGIVFGKPMSPRLARLIESRLDATGDGADPLDDLVGAAPAHVVEWMRRKARLADDTDVALPICDADVVDAEIRVAISVDAGWCVCLSRKAIPAWPIVHVALLRELCGVTLRNAGVRSGKSVHGAHASYVHHQRMIVEDDLYAERLGRVAAQALRSCHGSS